jgi:hypothetical protein
LIIKSPDARGEVSLAPSPALPAQTMLTPNTQIYTSGCKEEE